MSDDIERDDRILGTALSRAVESQPVRETPFEASRLAERLSRGGRSVLMPAFAAVAAVVLGLALGAALLGLRGQIPGPVATEPSPIGTPAATFDPNAPTPSATPRGPVERLRVYFARDLLPPVGAEVTTEVHWGPTTEGYIRARLEALATASAPPGTANIVPSLRTKPAVADVTVDGDLARVDYAVPNGDWGSAGSAGTLALVQQLVYTATEQAGVRRVLITENGGRPTTIDQLQIDRPLTREDVTGYERMGSADRIEAGDAEVQATLATAVSVEQVAPAMARLTVRFDPTGNVPEGRWLPTFTAQLRQNEGAQPVDSKWILELRIPNARPASGPTGRVDQTPLRAVQAVEGISTERPGATPTTFTSYFLYLDDARPWRVGYLIDPVRLVVDIGGHPQAVSESVAVYGPRPGDTVDRTFTISGLARAFEANVVWRVRDSGERVVATGHTTATIGTSAVWGAFEAQVTVPAAVTGSFTLEVLWTSPKDGSDVGLVRVPLRVR